MRSYLYIRDLDEELDELQERADDDSGEDGSSTDPLGDDERERLDALIALKANMGSEWDDGVSLISESDFEDYARDMAEDLYGLDACQSLPVDWERWAFEVQTDYSVVEFDGETYYYRG